MTTVGCFYAKSGDVAACRVVCIGLYLSVRVLASAVDNWVISGDVVPCSHTDSGNLNPILPIAGGVESVKCVLNSYLT